MLKKNLHHYIFPHHKTHKKARLLSEKALLIYVGLFFALQFGFKITAQTFPGILGTTSAITKEEIIALTNNERSNMGLPQVTENSALNAAAVEKAKNMFAENYWAHVSPSGKTPWLWIQESGYSYRYAGENLARGFSTSGDVVKAWMASKQGHKENLLNTKYQDIGIAVEDGIINGEKVTLVVQLFGTPTGAIAAKPAIDDTEGASTENKNNQIATTVPAESAPIAVVNSASTQTTTSPSFLSSYITINPTTITKAFGLSLISLLLVLAGFDLFIIARRKRYVQLHVRHMPHGAFMIITAIILYSLSSGAIL